MFRRNILPPSSGFKRNPRRRVGKAEPTSNGTKHTVDNLPELCKEAIDYFKILSQPSATHSATI
jgi:hypothetical protein